MSKKQELLELAYHESGHILASYIFGHDLVQYSDIEPDSLSGWVKFSGFGQFSGHPPIISQETIMVFLAGQVAEAILRRENPDEIQLTPGPDLDEAVRLAKKHCVTEMEIESFLHWLVNRTHGFLTKSQNRRVLSRLAKALYRNGVLEGEEVYEIIFDCKIGTLVGSRGTFPKVARYAPLYAPTEEPYEAFEKNCASERYQTRDCRIMRIR